MSHGWRKKGKKGRRPTNGKRKRPPCPPSEDFGDLEYSEEVSSKYDRSLAPVSPVVSFDDSDDSMGLSAVERAYIRSVERAGIGRFDDSEEVSSEEAKDSSNSKESSDGDEGDGVSSDGGDCSSMGGDDSGEGSIDGDGGGGEGSGNSDGAEGSSRGGGSDTGGRVPPA